MAGDQIIITYSEDFRENKKASKVYSILRDNGFDPILVTTNYFVSRGEGMTQFMFNIATRLPKESRIREMLSEVKLESVELK
jgi:hypothetical protein